MMPKFQTVNAWPLSCLALAFTLSNLFGAYGAPIVQQLPPTLVLAPLAPVVRVLARMGL